MNNNLGRIEKPDIPLEVEKTYIGIRITMEDGRIITPAIFIDGTSPTAELETIDASEYFEKQYKGKGIVSTHREENLGFLFNPDITKVEDWKSYKEKLFLENSNNQVTELIKHLNKEGISANIIKEIKEDLNFKRNEELFREYVELLIEDKEQKEKTIEALDLAIQAHKGQTQKRDKDKKGLDSIPYVNHPIRIALWALVELKMTAEEVQGFLLHDVVEDTEKNMEYIEKRFSKRTSYIVYNVTKQDNETRDEYMNRVNSLTDKASKILKCLDRYHNLLRGFGINDKKYLKKYIKETEKVYLPKFQELSEELGRIYLDFYETFEQFKIHCELQK